MDDLIKNWLYIGVSSFSHQPAACDNRFSTSEEVRIADGEVNVQRRFVLPSEIVVLPECDEDRTMTMFIYQYPANRMLKVWIEPDTNMAMRRGSPLWLSNSPARSSTGFASTG